MKLWRQLRRELRRFFKTFDYSQTKVRLARFQAYRLNGKDLGVVKIIPVEGGFLLQLSDFHDFKSVIPVFSNRPMLMRRGCVQLQYRSTAEENLITYLGRPRYECNPGSYLVPTPEVTSAA